MEKYKDWEIFDKLPDGFKIDNTAGSPLAHTVFITNGKSVLNGQIRALLRIIPNTNCSDFPNSSNKKEICYKNKSEYEPANKDNYIFPAKEVNELARKKFQEQLLKDISADLMICEIEGWDKREYINEIRNLLNGINI